MHPQTHIELVHFRKLNWVTVEQRVVYMKTPHGVQNLEEQCIQIFNQLFYSQTKSWLLYTRQNYIVLLKFKWGKKKFYTAVLWYNRPREIKLCLNMRAVKATVKTWLLQSMKLK